MYSLDEKIRRYISSSKNGQLRNPKHFFLKVKHFFFNGNSQQIQWSHIHYTIYIARCSVYMHCCKKNRNEIVKFFQRYNLEKRCSTSSSPFANIKSNIMGTQGKHKLKIPYIAIVFIAALPIYYRLSSFV